MTAPTPSILPSYYKLVVLLEKAAELSAQFCGGYSNRFDSAEAFTEELMRVIVQLKNGHTENLPQLSNWFAPTCDWDDLVGADGVNLGEEVYNATLLVISELADIKAENVTEPNVFLEWLQALKHRGKIYRKQCISYKRKGIL